MQGNGKNVRVCAFPGLLSVTEDSKGKITRITSFETESSIPILRKAAGLFLRTAMPAGIWPECLTRWAAEKPESWRCFTAGKGCDLRVGQQCYLPG